MELNKKDGIPKEELDKLTLDKYRRDGLLVAILLRHRQNKTTGNALVVSSSSKLCEACKDYKDKLGSLDPVASIGAVAYLLTLVPGVNMNMGTLKGLLFDVGFRQKLHGVDRVALRMVQASEQYFMPFSRRVTLRVHLNNKICETATQLGLKPEKVASDFVKGKLETESTTHIIAGAIDALVESKTERKIREQEREIRKLRESK